MNEPKFQVGDNVKPVVGLDKGRVTRVIVKYEYEVKSDHGDLLMTGPETAWEPVE